MASWMYATERAGAAAFGVECGAHQELDPVERGACGCVRDLVPQFECVLEILLGLGGGVDRLRRDARPDPRVERARQVVRRLPVVGELGGPGRVGLRRRLVGQRPRERGVEPGPLARQQLAVDGLLDEGMAKGISLPRDAVLRHEDVTGDRLAERGIEIPFVGSHDARQERRRDARPAGRGEPHQLLGRLAQRRDPRQEDLTQRVRKAFGTGPAASSSSA